MPWGLIPLTLITAAYILVDPVFHVGPIEVPGKQFERFLLTEVPGHLTVMFAFGDLKF